jgi:excisionase family DNA binding protein
MTAPTQEDRLLVTLERAGELLSVCPRTIARLCDRGELRRIPIGNRGMRVAVTDLQAWIERQQGGVS